MWLVITSFKGYLVFIEKIGGADVNLMSISHSLLDDLEES